MNCICPSFTDTEMALPLLGHGLSGEKNVGYRDLVLELGLIRYIRTFVFNRFAHGKLILVSDQLANFFNVMFLYTDYIYTLCISNTWLLGTPTNSIQITSGHTCPQAFLNENLKLWRTVYHIHREHCDKEYVNETSCLIETRVTELLSRNLSAIYHLWTLPAHGDIQ